MNHELAKTLTTALVQFIDRERTEGTMCCSNIECGALEEAFKSDNLDDVEAFIQKKLSRLTEFEQFMDGVVDDTIRETYSEDGFKDICKDALNLAKKELARRDEVITLNNLPPYDKGFRDGKAEAMADLERTFECNPDKLPIWLKDDIARKELNAHTKGYEQAEKDLADVAQFSSGPDGFFYGKGYQQAKKDCELTWEDIIELEDLMAMVHYEFRNGIGKESFGKEVLEKFKAMKEENK